ncbi:MAG: SMC-Scp complex subunit ScpB [Pseudomonadota bacterium]
MNVSDLKLKQIVEAALLAAEQPLNLNQLSALFEEAEAPSHARLREALEALTEDCAERGIEVSRVASGYRLQVRAELQPWISRLWAERPPRYSRALLETLAIIAYRQPMTRAEIEQIRGVSVSSNIMRTLQEREWVRIVGHRDVPGRPALYGTTRRFLDYFDLASLDELPTLSEIKDLAELEPELDLAFEGEATAEAVDASTEEPSETPVEDEAEPEADADSSETDAESSETVEAETIVATDSEGHTDGNDDGDDEGPGETSPTASDRNSGDPRPS